jgi:hypothetical protein
VVLGFELRALHLVGKYFSISQIFIPLPAFSYDHPDLCLQVTRINAWATIPNLKNKDSLSVTMNPIFYRFICCVQLFIIKIIHFTVLLPDTKLIASCQLAFRFLCQQCVSRTLKSVLKFPYSACLTCYSILWHLCPCTPAALMLIGFAIENKRPLVTSSDNVQDLGTSWVVCVF